MSSSIKIIMDSIVEAIEAVPPDDDPAAPFLQSTSLRVLDDEMLKTDELVRAFVVYPLGDPEDTGRSNFSQGEYWQTVVIELRYHITNEYGGEMHALLLSGSDAARITHQLELEWGFPGIIDGVKVSGPLISIIARPSRELKPNGNDNYTKRLEFRVRYTIDSPGTDQAPAP